MHETMNYKILEEFEREEIIGNAIVLLCSSTGFVEAIFGQTRELVTKPLML
jgi:hypothetical protein